MHYRCKTASSDQLNTVHNASEVKMEHIIHRCFWERMTLVGLVMTTTCPWCCPSLYSLVSKLGSDSAERLTCTGPWPRDQSWINRNSQMVKANDWCRSTKLSQQNHLLPNAEKNTPLGLQHLISFNLPPVLIHFIKTDHKSTLLNNLPAKFSPCCQVCWSKLWDWCFILKMESSVWHVWRLFALERFLYFTSAVLLTNSRS